MHAHFAELGAEMEAKQAERESAAKMLERATSEQERLDALVYVQQIDTEWNALMGRFANMMGLM